MKAFLIAVAIFPKIFHFAFEFSQITFSLSFFGMIPHQRHASDPSVWHGNLLITDCTACCRHGSASLVDLLGCTTHSLNKTMSSRPCQLPAQDVSSTNSIENSSDYLALKSSMNLPLSPHLSFPNQLKSPQFSLNLHLPSHDLHMNILHSPEAFCRCKACMSLLMDKAKGGKYLEQMRVPRSAQFASAYKPDSPTSYPASSPLTTRPPHMDSPSRPPPHSPSTLVTLPSPTSPLSQAARPLSLYEGDLFTHLNQCLHHIISRSCPTLSANKSVHSNGVAGGKASSVAENVDERQSLDTLISSPDLERNQLLSPCESGCRLDPLVG